MKKNNLTMFIILGLAISTIIFIVSIMISINWSFKNNKSSLEEFNIERVSEKQEIKHNLINEDTVPTNIQEIENETNYLIIDNNGYITIYVVDKNGNLFLRENTQIVTKYLPDLDKEKLKDGIYVNGREELNKTLEDYE